MTANEYQHLAFETSKPFYKAEGTSPTFKQLQLATAVLALTGEAGELANKVKKALETGNCYDHNYIELFVDELGDVQWYVAQVATMLNVTLEYVMGANIAKLREKYKDQLPNK